MHRLYAVLHQTVVNGLQVPQHQRDNVVQCVVRNIIMTMLAIMITAMGH